MPLDRDLSEKYSAKVSAWHSKGCKCQRTNYGAASIAGGGPIVRNQCLNCGRLIGNPQKRTPETELLNEIDREMEPAYDARRKGEYDDIARRYVALQRTTLRTC